MYEPIDVAPVLQAVEQLLQASLYVTLGGLVIVGIVALIEAVSRVER